MALPKRLRLSDSSEIKRVFKEGRTLNSAFFAIKFLPANLDSFRLAIIVSSKVSKKAVIRNKIKRKISEIIRPRVLKIKPGLYIVRVKPEALSVLNRKSDIFEKDLIRVLDKISK